MAEDLGGDVTIDMQSVESAAEAMPRVKEIEEKDENKVLYRGKMRKLFNCQVDGCMYKTLLRKDIERHSRVHTGTETRKNISFLISLIFYCH